MTDCRILSRLSKENASIYFIYSSKIWKFEKLCVPSPAVTTILGAFGCQSSMKCIARYRIPRLALFARIG